MKTLHLLLWLALPVFGTTSASAQSWSAFPCSAISNYVTEMATDGTTLYTTSPFHKFDLVNGCSSNFPLPGNMLIRALTVYNGDVYASGWAGFPDTTRIYRLTPSGWSSMAALPNGLIENMTVYNNELYVGGMFEELNGVAYNHVAKWNGVTWSDPGGGISGTSSAHVRTMAVFNNELYVAGDGFAPFASDIAKWNGATWSPVGIGISGSIYPIIFAMAVNNGYLYAGGRFRSAGGISVNNIARWNGNTWSDVGGGLVGADSIVYAMGVYQNAVYAGGSFTSEPVFGFPLNNIASFNGSGWSDVNGGVTGGFVQSFANYYGALLVGGQFTTAGGNAISFLAKLQSCASNITSTGTTNFCAGDSVKLTAPTGSAFQWLNNGVPIPGVTSQIYYPKVAGNYSCLTTNTCGTMFSNTIAVTIKPVPTAIATAQGPTTFCTGDSVYLLVTPAGGNSYIWYKYGNLIPGSNFSSYKAKTAGVYKARVMNSVGCFKKSNAIVVTVNPLPTASITAASSTSICAGDSVMLNATTNTPGSTFQWKKYSNFISGATSSTYAAKTTGKYKAVVTSPAGCVRASNSINVTVVCREMEQTVFSTIHIAPNPASEKITIDLPATDNAVISITDIAGSQKWLSEYHQGGQQLDVDISDLAPGIYFVQVRSDNKVVTGKFVKENNY
jgi:hypothetical protein